MIPDFQSIMFPLLKRLDKGVKSLLLTDESFFGRFEASSLKISSYSTKG